MARSDLLLGLVQQGLAGDRTRFRKTAEAVIAEERQKQHHVLADRLSEALTMPTNDGQQSLTPMLTSDQRIDSLMKEVTPQRQLDQLVLDEEVRAVCRDLIKEHSRRDLLRSYGLEPRNRLLLIGPPGNGKTTLAEAMAEALMLPMYVVRYEGVIGTFLGETANRLRKVIEFVSTRHCVLFFDEFETIGKERGDTHETGEIKRVVSSLLMQIDNLPSNVVVIAATNHPELLDRASWRRFQVRMVLPLPTPSALASWFTGFSKRMQIQFGYSPAALAKSLSGSSFAEAEEFGLSIVRQWVLEQPNANMKSIVARALRRWRGSTRTPPKKPRG